MVLNGKEFGQQKIVMPIFGCVMTTLILLNFSYLSSERRGEDPVGF